jgi:hypothetical protein
LSDGVSWYWVEREAEKAGGFWLNYRIIGYAIEGSALYSAATKIWKLINCIALPVR